jgi:hypothetical protein
MCPREEFFFGMNPTHMAAVGHLKALMAGMLVNISFSFFIVLALYKS